MAEETTPQGEQEPKAPSAPQETDWKAESRKWETRAKDNLAAAKANETAAQRLAQIEEDQKTEAQKAQERLDVAEKRAAELEVKATRAEVAAAKGVPIDLIHGSTKDDLEASADALIAFRGEVPKGPVIPGQGKQPEKTGAASPAQAFGDFLTNAINKS